MHHPARPLRLDNVAEALKCRGIRNASAPHRVQPWQWAARGSWRAAPGHQGPWRSGPPPAKRTGAD
ncbi:hypothetical protein HaLaN_33012 [Haematococcus lacustris]|uniref:Uncharacterized protein n=1 Tax=Haematococcus lacustris TaxID=44745 RepID=A0A6A0AP33_HAELA|nr:hypothetical protein HaLaN_33012 [Haematococcus lacustris]